MRRCTSVHISLYRLGSCNARSVYDLGVAMVHQLVGHDVNEVNGLGDAWVLIVKVQVQEVSSSLQIAYNNHARANIFTLFCLLYSS
jgi:hypothetical protein